MGVKGLKSYLKETDPTFQCIESLNLQELRIKQKQMTTEEKLAKMKKAIQIKDQVIKKLRF